MKLIADSGSTKTEWKLMGSTNVQTIFTEGYNPRILSSQQVQDSVMQHLCAKIPSLPAIHEIHFFGAGCEQDQPKATLKQALQNCFPEASIHIQSDMLAACIASSGKKAGICSILGTGSNSCFYDGEKIVEQVPALGYILGDEGSGNAIGKQIIKDYFYKGKIAGQIIQWEEANLVFNCAKQFMDEHGVTALTVHDEFIVEEKHYPMVKEFMYSSGYNKICSKYSLMNRIKHM